MILSCIGIGLFYILTTYAAAVYFGLRTSSSSRSPARGTRGTLARAAWGAGWVLVFLAIANSAIANSNASSNAATRTWFGDGADPHPARDPG